MDQQLKEEGEGSMEAPHEDLVNVDASNSSLLESLPIGIIQTILQNLPFPCLFRCTLLNKSFFTTMKTNMSFAHKHPFLLLRLKNSLYYMSLDSTDPILKKKIVLKPIEVNIGFQLSNIYITGSCNGYLCLSTTNGQNSTLIFNPLMPRSVKVISSTSMELSLLASGFGFNPRTDKLKVVRVYYKRDGASTKQHVQILNVGTDHWRTLDVQFEVYLRSRTSNYARGVCLSNGWIYWLGERRRTMTHVIVGLNLDNESFKEISIPNGQRSCDHYLIKANGRLVLVVYNKSKNELKIWEPEEHGENEFIWKRSMYGVLRDSNQSIIDQLPMDDDRDSYLAGIYDSTLYDVIYFEHDKLLLQFKNVVLCYDLRRKELIEFEVAGLPNLGGDQKEFEMVVFHGSVLDAERCML